MSVFDLFLPAFLCSLSVTSFHISSVYNLNEIRNTKISTISMSKVARNENFAKLQAGYGRHTSELRFPYFPLFIFSYLFPEIARLRNAYLEKNPDAKIISLGK